MQWLGVFVLLGAAAACSPSGPSSASASGAGLFLDVTAAARLSFTGEIGTTFPQLDPRQQIMQRNMGNGVAVGDYDGDGDLDLYLLGQGERPNRLYRNDLDRGTKTFTDVTPPALADLGLSRVAHFADLDGDGDLDLLLINDDDGTAQARPSRIFRNNGDASFTDVTASSGFRPVGHLRCGAALADYDRDGLLDVYVTNWGMGGPAQANEFPGSNRLYRNLGGLVFEDVTAAAGLDGLARDSFTAIFSDFDDDGFLDLYVAIDHTSDEFYWNRGGVFTNATGAVNAVHVGNDMGVACADFDDDGDLDLYATNITDPSTARGITLFNVLYVNHAETTGTTVFADEARARGVADTYWGWGVEFVDVENDGDLDLVAVTGFDEFVRLESGPASPVLNTPSVLLLNDGTGRFARRTGTALDHREDSRALVAFDYDRDGDLDLLITNVGQPARLLENVSPAPGHWLGLVLTPHDKAVGAAVYATLGSTTKRRDVIAGRSYLAGTPSEVHFGLGAATRVDTLRIRWADGTEQTLHDVAADQLLRLAAP
ncbi:MAG: CRTAC1 family protein [Planctomycetota bacterium]|jgi:hypothetical protein